MWLLACGWDTPEKLYRQAESTHQTGDFLPSLEIARKGLARWPPGKSEWGWKFLLSYSENLISLGRKDEAAKELSPYGRPPGPLLARWCLAKSFLPGEQVDRLLADALREATAHHDLTRTGFVRLSIGNRLLGQSKFEKAEAEYRAVLDLARSIPCDELIARSVHDLGWNRQKQSRFDEAIPFYDQALQIEQRIGAKALIAVSTGNRGWCLFRLGDLPRALMDLDKAREVSAAIGLRDYEHRWLTDLGIVYDTKGDFERAIALEIQAARVAQDTNDSDWLALAWNNAAEMSLTHGDLATAERYHQQAMRSLENSEDLQKIVPAELLAARIDSAGRRYAQAEAELQQVIPRAKEAKMPELVWQAFSSLAALYRATGRPKQAEAEFRHAIGAIDEQWSQVRDESKTTFLTEHLLSFFQDYVDFLIKTGRQDQALEVAESARARLLSRRLEDRGLPPELRLDQLLRDVRATNTVVLSYWLEPSRSSVWLIGAGPITRYDLPKGKAIQEMVDRYTAAIKQGRDPLTQQDAAGSSLYEAVVGPVARRIPKGANVIIVPSGALHQLNFETLVVPTPVPHYWIEDVTIATAPALRVLQAAVAKPRAPRLLLLGDPALDGSGFLPLPSVRQEIAAVEEHFPDRVDFTGANAFPAQYAKAAPAGFTNIHFATHATANPDSPLNSAIILSRQGENFKLYARDVAPVPLTADLVTISACSSAGPTAYSGEGLMGFAWAFLYAGAQNVIATLWEEDDKASVELMRGLYTALAAGESPARALHSAKLALLRSKGPFHLPYYWGPLQVFTRRIAR